MVEQNTSSYTLTITESKVDYTYDINDLKEIQSYIEKHPSYDTVKVKRKGGCNVPKNKTS